MSKKEVLEVFINVKSETNVSYACSVIGLSKSFIYHKLKPKTLSCKIDKRKNNPIAIDIAERDKILTVMNSTRYMDKTPYTIYYSLLDAGIYYCSIRTMYRILEENEMVKERRRIRRSTSYEKPELLATKPNELWSWDITKVKGPKKWTYFYLYVIIDVFSRYVVGYMVAYKEKDFLAKTLIQETCIKQNISKDQLTLHADNGSSMISKTVGELLTDLEVTKTHSRPYTSNDNPYSESQFKTMKYRPEFPKRFYSINELRLFCRRFFKWYNNEHYHSGLSFMKPKTVHYGNDKVVVEKRNKVLSEFYNKNPERFKNGIPRAKDIENEVWINKPENNEKELSNLV